MTLPTAEDLGYCHDGLEMRGRVFAGPEGAPGILVVHGAHGLTPFIETRAARLAGRGYHVLAVDLWGGGRRLSPPEFGPHLEALAADRAGWMGRIQAARSALAARPGIDGTRIGALGYCFGGATVLEAARTGVALAGVVSLHAGLAPCADDWRPGTRTEVLISTGAQDPLAPPEDLARITGAMSAAGVAWQMLVHGGARHAFTEPDDPRSPPFAAYDARADRRATAALDSFFADILA